MRLAKSLLQYAQHSTHGGSMKLSLSRNELAEMAGGMQENVNRCLRGWQRQGIFWI
ncbi:MAG: helix-turn-helix domain-containing protein [Xanthobacteraceae bacterium]